MAATRRPAELMGQRRRATAPREVRSGSQKGAKYWYDESKGYLVYKKNEYSGGGRQMSPDEWTKFKQKLTKQENE